VQRLHQVFQENDCGVCHASLELAINDGRHLQRRDSFVHDHARVPAKYACVMVHRLKRFQTPERKSGVASNRRGYLEARKENLESPRIFF